MHRYHNNRRILVGDFALDKLASEVNETKFRSAVAVMRDFESAIRIKRILTGAYSCTPSYSVLISSLDRNLVFFGAY